MLLALLTIKELNKPIEIPKPVPTVKTTQVVKIEPPVIYQTIENDNLTKIAESHATTVERLWQANPNLTSPDLVPIDTPLTIPPQTAILAPRALPTPEPITYTTTPQTAHTGNSEGNSYQAGQCVWFIKNMRPELPNNWGSASSWLYNAQSQGWPTGSVPRVGAVGVRGNHVVLIVGINPDGSVDIKDMNGRYVAFEVGYGTHPPDYYSYIY